LHGEFAAMAGRKAIADTATKVELTQSALRGLWTLHEELAAPVNHDVNFRFIIATRSIF
jgi:hypothetical protein